jgi:hypothetical protein
MRKYRCYATSDNRDRKMDRPDAWIEFCPVVSSIAV